MKILMPYIDIANNSIFDPKISGGTELFSRLICENFDIEVVTVPWHTNLHENKHYVRMIQKIAHDKKCDLILSNNIKSVCFNSLRSIGKPIMRITHTNYGIIDSNEKLGKVESFGHSIFGVSNFNINYMHRKSDRFGIPRVNYSGIIRPAYAKYDLPVQTTPEPKIVTVGRSNSYKAPFAVYRYFGNSPYKPVVITSVGVDEDSINYYNRNKNLPHLLNLPHDVVMEHMRTATACTITCAIETYGIAALESLSVGTPLLIKTNNTGTHTSTEIAADPNFYRLLRDDTDPIQLLDQLSKVDRLAIKQSTLEKHSKNEWIKTLINAFELTIQKYKKQNSNTLDDFLR